MSWLISLAWSLTFLLFSYSYLWEASKLLVVCSLACCCWFLFCSAESSTYCCSSCIFTSVICLSLLAMAPLSSRILFSSWRIWSPCLVFWILTFSSYCVWFVRLRYRFSFSFESALNSLSRRVYLIWSALSSSLLIVSGLAGLGLFLLYSYLIYTG